MTLLGEEHLAGYLEVDRLVGERSSLFVLRVKTARVSDLRARQLWHTPEWPPGRVRPWAACLRTTEQLLKVLTGVVFVHGTIQRGFVVRVGVSRRRRRHFSAWLGGLALPEGIRLNGLTKSGRRYGCGTTASGRRRRLSAGSSGLSCFMASVILWRWARMRSRRFSRR
jgi:hypothetical protein